MQNLVHNGQRLTVVERNPFTRAGEVLVKAGEKIRFADKVGQHSMYQDFEVSSILFKFTALAEGAVCDVQPSILDRLVKIDAHNAAMNQNIGESLPLQVVDGHSTFRWTPKQPLIQRRGDCVILNVSARESFDVTIDGKRRRIDQIRIEATFDGELLTYATSAPSAGKVTFEAEAPLPG